MVLQFCKRQTEQSNPTACCIFHNGHKIEEFKPPNPTNHIVFAAQDSHCFFYTACNNVAMKTKLRVNHHSCLRVPEPFPTERAKPWSEWRPYLEIRPLAAEGFQTLSLKRKRTDNKPDTHPYYTMDDNLQELWDELPSRIIGKERGYGTDPEVITVIFIKIPGKADISIRSVPREAHDMNAIAKNMGFKYTGSSLAKFGDDLRVACIRVRPELTPEVRELVKSRQDYRCAKCGEPEIQDIDHIRPRSDGGTDTPDNYQALCGPCHALKTEQEAFTFTHAWHSFLSRDTTRSTGRITAAEAR